MEDISCQLTPEEISLLSHIIRSNFDPSETLRKINPKLRNSYDTRNYQYDMQLRDKNPFGHLSLHSQVVKIPLEKMNNEERFLHAFLSPSNIKEDLPSLLDYTAKMMDNMTKINENVVTKNEECIIKKVLSEGISNFYSSKAKLYIDIEEDEDDEEERKKLKEKEKNRVPMTEEEIQKELAEIQSHPMFMTEIPENAEDNVYLQAIQALKYEGLPTEVALDFMEKSKECLSKYKETLKFNHLKEAMYNICTAIEHIKDDSTVPDNVKYDLFFYRAGIQIMVKNLGYAIDDLNDALFYSDDDEAYLLLIDCYTKLEAYDKALKVICSRKKKLSEIDIPARERIKQFVAEEEKITEIRDKIADDLEKLEAFKNMDNDMKLKLYDDLTKKGIKLKPQIHNIPPGYAAHITIDDERKFHFPVLIIYEEFNTTDYIQDVKECIFISEILEIIFQNEKLPWDSENKYNNTSCQCFFEISNYDSTKKKETSYYLPLRSDDKLIDVLTNKKVYMNGFPVIVVVSFLSRFYEHFMKTKAIIKRKSS